MRTMLTVADRDTWSGMASISESIRAWALAPVTAAIREMRTSIMASVASVLTEVRDGLNGPLRDKVTALLASEAQARRDLAIAQAESAGLQAEDVAESQAATEVRDAFNDVAGLFQPADVPADPVAPIDPTTDAPAEVPSDPNAPAPGSQL